MIDVLITHVHDACRFKHYMKVKFNSDSGIEMAENINDGYHIRLNNLPECDVRYLQQNMGSIDKSQICKLKIIKSTPMRPRINPASFVNEEGKSQKKEQQPEEITLFKVKFTKIIHFDEHLTKHQIEELLKNPEVKSINIEK